MPVASMPASVSTVPSSRRVSRLLPRSTGRTADSARASTSSSMPRRRCTPAACRSCRPAVMPSIHPRSRGSRMCTVPRCVHDRMRSPRSKAASTSASAGDPVERTACAHRPLVNSCDCVAVMCRAATTPEAGSVGRCARIRAARRPSGSMTPSSTPCGRPRVPFAGESRAPPRAFHVFPRLARASRHRVPANGTRTGGHGRPIIDSSGARRRGPELEKGARETNTASITDPVSRRTHAHRLRARRPDPRPPRRPTLPPPRLPNLRGGHRAVSAGDHPRELLTPGFCGGAAAPRTAGGECQSLAER